MRGRPMRKRFIRFMPEITYFKPAGIPLRNLSEVVLGLDETEALRLAELEDLDQSQAAKKMKISRITFQRILHKAHKKIADALIYGKAIKMEGGEVIMPNLDQTGPMGQGPMTGRGAGRRNVGRGQGIGGSKNCYCPNCKKEFPHQRGVPCIHRDCPECGKPLRGVFCK